MRLLFVILLALPQFLPAQNTLIHLDEVSLQFELPNKNWHLEDKQKKDKNVVFYLYKREDIQDSAGLKVSPTIAFILEDINAKTDVVTYAAMKRMQLAFEVDEVFIHGKGGISYSNAVGFKSHYTDESGRKHITYYVCLKTAKQKNKGIQLVMDTTESTFDIVGKEFQKLLVSLK